MPSPLRFLFLATCVCVGAVACDPASRTSQSAGAPAGSGPAVPSAPTPVYPALQPVRIVSGPDRQPVGDARIVINESESYTSDANGLVTPLSQSQAPSGAAIDVDAPGFLPRRTTIPTDRVVTLWPGANEAEAAAVRQMVYKRHDWAGEVLHPPDLSDYLYVDVMNVGGDVVRAWSNEARLFGAAVGFSPGVSVRQVFGYDANEIEVNFGGPPRCDLIKAWGFCQEASPYETFQVQPELAVDPVVIRRVLVSWLLGPNPLPGYMNPEAPADDLSPLETQTIKMILIRYKPNRWPDDDRW